MTQALIAAVIAIAVLLGLQTLRLAKEQTAHQTTKTEFANRLVEQGRLARVNLEAVRSKEVSRVIALEGVIHANTEKLAAAQTDAAAARLAGDRLRDKLARIAAASRERSANSSPATSSPPTDDATMVLADVLVRLDARAGELAEFATRAHQAGKICEASYDAVKGAGNQKELAE